MIRILVYSILVFLGLAPMIVGVVSYEFKVGTVSSLLFGVATAVILWGGFILEGLRKITAAPPHKAQLMIFGRRQWKEVEVSVERDEKIEKVREAVFRNEGWQFFPLNPYWYGYKPIKVERISFTIVAEKVRTPDRANSKVPVFLTIRPLPEKFIEYIDSGEEEGAKEQLTGKVQERVREWAMADEEGPADWRELNKSQLEAVSVLVTRIARNSISQIPDYAQEVPTFIWLRYFLSPRPKKFFVNEAEWMENDWAKVKEVLKRIVQEHGPKAEAVLKEAVEKRREQIESLRTGAGSIVVEDLGVTIERLNIGDINVLGGVGEQAEKQARELEEREGEVLELKHVQSRVEELMKLPFKYSPEQALEIVQTERGKVVKTIDEKKISIAPETRGLVKEVAVTLGGQLARGGKK